MKKGIFWVLTVFFLFALTSLAFSEEEPMTPGKISGIWKGNYNYIPGGAPRQTCLCRAIFTPNLNGIMSCFGQGGQFDFIFDGKGDIVNNQLIIRYRENPNWIRIEARITKKNRLEGEVHDDKRRGDIAGFKKIRELTDEEKQWPLSKLKGLLK
jgi:hypothetical protein